MWATMCVAIREGVQLVQDVLVENGNGYPPHQWPQKKMVSFILLSKIYLLPACSEASPAPLLQQAGHTSGFGVGASPMHSGWRTRTCSAHTHTPACLHGSALVLSQGVNVGYGLAPRQPHTPNFIVCCYNFNGHVLAKQQITTGKLRLRKLMF